MREFEQTVIVIRHGDTVDKEVDPERPLTDTGRSEASVVGRWLAEAGVRVEEVRHSGKTRAEQTADLVAEALELEPAAVRQRKGLAPNDDVSEVAAGLRTENGSVAIVGHLPHVARLTSLLLTGDADRLHVEFPSGGAVVVGRDDADPWHLLAFVDPATLSGA